MKIKSLVVISTILLILLSGCIGKETGTANTTPTKINTTKNATNVTKDTVFPTTIFNLQYSVGYNWINWAWDNPSDADFSYTNIYLDNKFKVNLTKPKNNLNLTGLAAGKEYTISIRTVDASKNVNPSWVNMTGSTQIKPTPTTKPKDTSPPAKIDNLNALVGRTWTNWTWDNPSDADFSYTNIYMDGKFKVNLTKPKNYYNITGLAQNITKTISIRTVDTSRNVNTLWVNNTATTILDMMPAGIVTNMVSTIGRTWINWTWDNPSDVDFSYAMVYRDGIFKTNTSKIYYNATGLRNSTSYTLSMLTVDTSKNINTDWVNSTETTLE